MRGFLRRRPNRDRGVALIITLWVVLVVSVIAMTYAYEARIETQIVSYRADSLRAYYIAKAGMSRAMVLIREDLLKDHNVLDRSDLVDLRDDELGIRYDAYSESWAWGPEDSGDDEGAYVEHRFRPELGLLQGVDFGRYTVEVIDESAKINLNANGVDFELLKGLVLATGVEDEEKAAVVAAAVVDYRDQDDSPTLVEGARELGEQDSEATYWNPGQDPDVIREEAGPAFVCKNGPFGSVEEILLILEHLERSEGEGGVGILDYGDARSVFFGEDANGDGELNANEDDGGQEEDDTYPPDNGDGDLWLGISDHLTVDSIGRVNINTAKLPVLAAMMNKNFEPDEAVDQAKRLLRKRGDEDRRSRLNDSWKTWDDVDVDDEIRQAIQASGMASLSSDTFTILSTGEYPAPPEKRYSTDRERSRRGVLRTLKATVTRDFREAAVIEKERKNRVQRGMEQDEGAVDDPRDDDQARIFVKRFSEVD